MSSADTAVDTEPADKNSAVRSADTDFAHIDSADQPVHTGSAVHSVDMDSVDKYSVGQPVGMGAVVRPADMDSAGMAVLSSPQSAPGSDTAETVTIDVKRMGIDSLSLSGHKLYAPKGVGMLYVRNGIEFEKFMDGGHQEKNRRAGTENVAGIVGLGKACELANYHLEEHMRHLTELRDYFMHQGKCYWTLRGADMR